MPFWIFNRFRSGRIGKMTAIARNFNILWTQSYSWLIVPLCCPTRVKLEESWHLIKREIIKSCRIYWCIPGWRFFISRQQRRFKRRKFLFHKDEFIFFIFEMIFLSTSCCRLFQPFQGASDQKITPHRQYFYFVRLVKAALSHVTLQ